MLQDQVSKQHSAQTQGAHYSIASCGIECSVLATIYTVAIGYMNEDGGSVHSCSLLFYAQLPVQLDSVGSSAVCSWKLSVSQQVAADKHGQLSS